MELTRKNLICNSQKKDKKKKKKGKGKKRGKKDVKSRLEQILSAGDEISLRRIRWGLVATPMSTTCGVS